MIKFYINPDSKTTGLFLERIKVRFNQFQNSEGRCYIGYPEPIINNKRENELLALLIVEGNGIYYFYDDENRQKNSRRFLFNKMSVLPDLFDIIDDVVFPVDINQIDQFNLNDTSGVFNRKLFKQFISLIQDIYNMAKEDNRTISKNNSLGAKIKSRNESLKELDEIQYLAIHSNITQHTRIRGLAGSGKTIIMVQKMAHLHFQYPDKVIVYTYTTKSLGEFVTMLFEKAFAELTTKTPDYKVIKIMHTWGSSYITGVYRDICVANGEQSLPFKSGSTIIPFSAACNLIFPKVKVSLYDYVFIDEAQDVPLSFYKIVNSSLKKGGRIIYAYDEMQSFNRNSVPSKSEIFGRNIQLKDINLPRSYRTPMQILVTAHAIGMGIYNIDDLGSRNIKNFVGDESIWEVVGYTCNPPKIVKGKDVVLSRKYVKDEISDFESADLPLIKFIGLETFEKQVDFVVTEIKKLIYEENIVSNDILVVDLDSVNYKDNFVVFNKKLFQSNISIGNMKLNSNLVDENSDLTFRIDNSVPYTSINRSKGNEASIVYLLNANHDSVHESYWRRRLFTAMTRSKYLIRVLGTSDLMTKLENEYNNVSHNGFTLKFKYPTLEETKNIFTLAKIDEEEVKQMDSGVQIFDSLESVEKQLELLARQLGVKRDELPIDLIDIVKKRKIQ